MQPPCYANNKTKSSKNQIIKKREKNATEDTIRSEEQDYKHTGGRQERETEETED
jgi:hypothetical protein